MPKLAYSVIGAREVRLKQGQISGLFAFGFGFEVSA